MGFIDSIKQKVNEIKEQKKESAEFRKYAEEKAKPIRRSAYLKQRMKQAIKEGEAIAKKEFEKNQPTDPKKKDNPFGLVDPATMINTEPYFKSNKSKEDNKNGK